MAGVRMASLLRQALRRLASARWLARIALAYCELWLYYRSTKASITLGRWRPGHVFAQHYLHVPCGLTLSHTVS